MEVYKKVVDFEVVIKFCYNSKSEFNGVIMILCDKIEVLENEFQKEVKQYVYVKGIFS